MQGLDGVMGVILQNPSPAHSVDLVSRVIVREGILWVHYAWP